jgi:hypothetical protein
MMEAVRTSETSVDNHFTRQYIPEDNFEHHGSELCPVSGFAVSGFEPLYSTIIVG